MGDIEFLFVTLLVLIHIIFLIVISSCNKKNTIEIKIVITLYIFYTIGYVVPFSLEFFAIRVLYSPTIFALLLSVFLDFSFAVIIYIVNNLNFDNNYIRKQIVTERFAYFVLIFLSVLAFIIDIYYNGKYFILAKNEFIGVEKKANLLYFSIPYSFILFGAALYFPFKKKLFKSIVVLLAFLSIVLSFFQGYRSLVFFFVLFFIFKKLPKIQPLVPALLMTLVGELSNPIKNLFFALLLDENFNLSEFVSYYLNNLHLLLGISSEQRAIISNFVIGSETLYLGLPLLEMRNILPFTNSLFGPIGFSRTEILGQLAGVGFGQGTAYNFHLFALETFFLSLVLLFFLLYWVKLTSNSLLAPLTWGVMFSVMRDATGFLSGQIKMILIFILFIYLCNDIGRFLKRIYKTS